MILLFLNRRMIGKECRRIITIMLVVITFIVMYWLVLMSIHGTTEMSHHDILNQRVMDNPFTGSPLSWWPFTHLFLFMLLGWMFPSCIILLFSFGVGWELIEMGMASLFSQPYHYIRTSTGVEYPNWWAGSTLDVGMNTIGLLIGWILSQKIGILKVKYLNIEDKNEKRWIYIGK